ncbi:MAG TPA: DUF1648 domain-containing protein [Pyrinomonadaceae bacterium]|nr:DUF1648 domain-containing protein [Pyrinomonadaceae bacterium]
MIETLLIFLLVDAVLFAIFMYAPVMRGEDVFFGVRVGTDFYNGEGRKLLHRYWFWLSMTFIEIELIGAIISVYRGGISAAQIAPRILILPLTTVLYVIFYRQVKAYELPEENRRFASALITRRLGDYTSIAVEIAVTILILLPTLVLVYYYPKLPARIPVHWNLWGEPDAWARKNFGAVFFLPLMGVYMQGAFLLLKHALLGVKMTLPAEKAQEYLHYKEMFLRTSLKLLDRVRVILAFMFCTMALEIVFTALDDMNKLARVLLFVDIATLALLIACCAYACYRLVKIDRELKTKVGRVYVQRSSDAAHWYAGGLLYFNPQDPALVVEKLAGFGYTLNMANKRAYVYLAYLICTPLLISWLLSGA